MAGEITAKELLLRAPKFFHRQKIYLFQHCFDKLEYVFPEIDWKNISVAALRDVLADAVHQARNGCEHPKENVEYIAQKEYPGGGVLWCKRCGAWCDDEEQVWNAPGEDL